MYDNSRHLFDFPTRWRVVNSPHVVAKLVTMWQALKFQHGFYILLWCFISTFISNFFVCVIHMNAYCTALAFLHLAGTCSLLFERLCGLLKNYVDFCCSIEQISSNKIYMTTTSYLLSLTLKISCIQHEFVWSYASSKIHTITVPGHVNDVMSVLLFTQ